MKQLLKRAISRILPLPPMPALTIDNFYAYLDVLWQKRYVQGPVVEIGCATGGTSALACRFLAKIGCEKQYWCFDTFEGFVESQLSTDHKLGLARNLDAMFSKNSPLQFKRNLSRYRVTKNVNIVKGDICEVGEERLPDNISVCLLDVDLRDPTYTALKMLKPRMAKGGIILVDDCKKDTGWVGANIGYIDFITDAGLEPKYYMGFGVVEPDSIPDTAVSWLFCREPNPLLGNSYYGESTG